MAGGLRALRLHPPRFGFSRLAVLGRWHCFHTTSFNRISCRTLVVNASLYRSKATDASDHWAQSQKEYLEKNEENLNDSTAKIGRKNVRPSIRNGVFRPPSMREHDSDRPRHCALTRAAVDSLRPSRDAAKGDFASCSNHAGQSRRDDPGGHCLGAKNHVVAEGTFSRPGRSGVGKVAKRRRGCPPCSSPFSEGNSVHARPFAFRVPTPAHVGCCSKLNSRGRRCDLRLVE
jgi:hypothetical protein